MKKANIDVFSHNFKITQFDRDFYRHVLEFCRPLMQVDLGGDKQVTKIFAASTALRDEFRIHRNMLNDFYRFMENRGIKKEHFVIKEHELPPQTPLALAIKEGITPRDYQIPIVKFINEPNRPTRVITIQTGRGKTLISIMGMVEWNERVAICVPAKFTDKWYSDIIENTDALADDILYIKKLKDFYALLRNAKDGYEIKQKVLVYSNTLIQMFLSDFEANPKLTVEMACHPEELYEVLKVGYRIIDEVHTPAHLNFKMDLYTNIRKAVYLTATMDSKDPFMTRMRAIAYPRDDRYQGLAYDQYIEVRSYAYGLKAPKRARYKNRKGHYSHVAFEQYVMKHKDVQDRYVSMILELLNGEYYAVREVGQKAIVFAATVEFCTILAEAIRCRWPSLTVGRYVAEDDYEVLHGIDVVVSTVLSAGTGVDIDGLVYALMTTSLDSSQSNEQVMGRLRRLKRWPNTTPVFGYLYTGYIDKQVKYHQNKLQYFKGKAKLHINLDTGAMI